MASRDADDLVEKVKKLSTSDKNSVLLNVLLEKLQTQEAFIGEDEKGRPVIEYNRKQQLYWDASNANKIAKPKTDEDLQQKTAAVLEMIDFMKKHKPPSGITYNATKTSPNAGYYREGKEFEVTEEILGKGTFAGDIMVVKDKVTGSKNALKTILISVFRKEEILAWVDINDTDICPALYLFKLEGNKIHIHMEILENAITLRDIIDEHMPKLRNENPELVKPFSLCIFHDILDTVQKMHDKGWTHRDLHAGNIMVQKQDDVSVKVKVLDFGLAGSLHDEKDGMKGFRTDIAEIVRKFSALYTGEEFDNETDLQKNWKDKMNMMTDGLRMSKEDKIELFHLIDSALQIVSPMGVQGFKEEVKQKLNDLNMEKDSIMRKVIQILFPKEGKKVSTSDSMAGGDGNVLDSGQAEGVDEEEEDLLTFYRQTMGIGEFRG